MIFFCITEEANGWKEENKKSIGNSINLLIFKPNKWCISLNLHLRLHLFQHKTFSPNSIFHIFGCLVQLKMLVKPKKISVWPGKFFFPHIWWVTSNFLVLAKAYYGFFFFFLRFFLCCHEKLVDLCCYEKSIVGFFICNR